MVQILDRLLREVRHVLHDVRHSFSVRPRPVHLASFRRLLRHVHILLERRPLRLPVHMFASFRRAWRLTVRRVVRWRRQNSGIKERSPSSHLLVESVLERRILHKCTETLGDRIRRGGACFGRVETIGSMLLVHRASIIEVIVGLIIALHRQVRRLLVVGILVS